MSLEQYQQHRVKAAPAIRKAAERILESVDDPKSPIYRTAKRVILQEDANTLGNANPARQMQVFEETAAFLAAVPESKPDRSDLSLAMTVARGLEFTRNRQLASKAYTRFGELFATSPDGLFAQTGRQFLGAARRLDLLGNEMKLEGKLLDGSGFQWEAYRGKVVLVDYWATWCGPCRAELPNVKKNYEKYHEQGFEVVGISLDTQRQAVEKYLKEQEIPWATLYQDGAGWSHPAAVYYGVSAIPTVILVNREGKVVSLQARGPELGRLLEEMIDAGDSP